MIWDKGLGVRVHKYISAVCNNLGLGLGLGSEWYGIKGYGYGA